MKTWDDYKNLVKSVDSTSRKEIETMEETAAIISAIIRQRNELGLSQRELATLCEMPQSSIARIETMKTMPSLDTLVKVVHNLGLKLSVEVV